MYLNILYSVPYTVLCMQLFCHSLASHIHYLRQTFPSSYNSASTALLRLLGACPDMPYAARQLAQTHSFISTFRHQRKWRHRNTADRLTVWGKGLVDSQIVRRLEGWRRSQSPKSESILPGVVGDVTQNRRSIIFILRAFKRAPYCGVPTSYVLKKEWWKSDGDGRNSLFWSREKLSVEIESFGD